MPLRGGKEGDLRDYEVLKKYEMDGIQNENGKLEKSKEKPAKENKYA